MQAGGAEQTEDETPRFRNRLKAKARIAVDLGPLSVRFQLSKPSKLVLKADPARRMYHPHFTLICRDFYELALREEPLAMQKVEGSSPFSRSVKFLQNHSY
jgi:hypothetical protein